MILKLCSLLFFLAFSLNLDAQDKYKMKGNFRDLPFKDFVAKAESIFAVKFFYMDEWVKGLKASVYSDSTSISGILNNFFKGTSLYYLIEESGHIVITNNYALKVSEITEEKDTAFLPPGENVSHEQNRQAAGNEFVEIGNPAEKNNTGKVTVYGYITDMDSKDPLAGVTVYIRKLPAGTITNAYGYYALSLPRGTYTIQFLSIGMKKETINVNLYGAGEMNIEMKGVLIPLKEIVVSAEKNVTLRRFEVGAEKINMTTFKLSPTSIGESDIIRSVLLLPGVQSVGEGSMGFNVRGGSSDQNLILLYGAPVYNSSHFFGFFSAVNSDIIKDVTLYKGGIPSRYGGRISSVLDIGTIEGNRKKFGGTAGISPITTHLMVEGPIIKNTLTYIFTARTTYSDWILKSLNDPALRRSRAFFYDLNAKITWDINASNKVDFSAYNSHDLFRFNSDTIYNYYNNILALRWRHFFSSKFFTSISINNSNYYYNISSQHIANEAFILSHKVNSTGFKADLNWFPGKNEVNFGLDLTRYAIEPGSYLPKGDSSLIEPDIIEQEHAWEGSLYAENKFPLTDYLSVNLGIRLSTFFSLGPKAVMIYKPGYPKSISTIMDTLNFSSGRVISKYAGPEFRVSLNFRISDRNSLKINYNRTRQYLHLLSNTTSISPTDTWKLCDYYLKPEIGDQIAVGFYEMLFNNRIEVSTELYYKSIRNMIDFKGGTDLVMNDNIEKDIINVRGRAYGLELVIKKVEGRIRYSIGYTYSRTILKSIGTFREEIINSGKWFPGNFDKPNDLVVTLNYLFSRRYSFSANYIWSTGRPITYPVSTYYLYENLLIYYSERNKYRIPDYSRLDISFKIGGNLRSHKIARPVWTFSVYNLLGRQNVYSVYFKNVEDVIHGYKLSIFGRAIPSVSYSFDF